MTKTFSAVNPMTVEDNYDVCPQCEGEGYFIDQWLGGDNEMHEQKVTCECRETDYEPE